MSYVESPKQDATDGELAAIRHAASAAEVDVNQKISAIEMEENIAIGVGDAARRKEAGYEQDIKYSNAEADVGGSMVTDSVFGGGTIKTALDLGVSALEDMRSVGDDAKSHDAAKLVKGGLAKNPKNMFEIKTESGRSLAEKTGTGSMESLVKAKGITDNGAGAAELKVSGIRQVVENSYTHRAANEKVLGQVVAAERNGAPVSPQGPGGMGAGGQAPIAAHAPAGLALNNMANGPVYKETNSDDGMVS